METKRYSGQDLPSEHARKGSINADTPWYLQLDHGDEVVYDPAILTVRQGTLTGLVEHLTRHDKLDAVFNDSFLMTYPSFVSAPELFEKLLVRFYTLPPEGLSESETEAWIQQKQKMIRFRVVNILKNWFGRFWLEQPGEDSAAFARQAYHLVQTSPAITEIPGAQQLLVVMEQRLQDKSTKHLVPPPIASAPPPIVPKNLRKIKLLDIDPTEFARQLTILEYRHYARIKPTECLNNSWQRKGPNEKGNNVNAMILHSNQLSNWVGAVILAQTEIKKRVMLIKHFITIADKCRSLNNYATMMSIISGLGMTPIYRLYMTWPQLSPKVMNTLEEMRDLMSSTKNFGKYRENLRCTHPPCVPFLGIYLTDLVFIEDGIPNHAPNGMINFSKRLKVGEVLQDIQQFQNTPYVFQPVSELQDYLMNGLQGTEEASDLYERSTALEPRRMGEEGFVQYAATGSHMSSVVIASMAMR
ncbi:Ras-GEF domain-containing protein [Aspergillus ruber CBS 135680]|uniref:Ras GEF n=1 Tax=Aspergillus ruber (strain CBS 135680) TaxID=1388766 RepID=A0A017S974_ASPRC|nr:ras GEF [Aspergillus ruber CBS 135680]EYE93376.1 ras GEF [Aspergillus ruber CBS 135680]